MRLIRLLAEERGVGQATIIEMAVRNEMAIRELVLREMAKREGVK